VPTEFGSSIIGITKKESEGEIYSFQEREDIIRRNILCKRRLYIESQIVKVGGKILGNHKGKKK
jgi:hypothetical protein